MKKEVISYCGFSMMLPETVELLDNNKGRVIIDEIAQIVDISDYKILSFWDRIERNRAAALRESRYIYRVNAYEQGNYRSIHSEEYQSRYKKKKYEYY